MDFQTSRDKLFTKVREALPEQVSHLSWDKQQLSDYRLQQAKHILNHAKNHTDYYARILKEIDLDNFTFDDWHKIPISCKQDTLDHWNGFIRNGIITRPEAEKHLQDFRDGVTDNPFYQDDYLLFATGGTSGQRGLFMWHNDDFAKMIALAYRYQIFDEQSSDKIVKKMATVVAPTWIHASIPVFAAQYRDEVEVKHIPADLPLHEIARQLESFQPDHIIGYSSVIVEISHLANSDKLNIKPFGISTNSEPLDQEGRESILQAWNVKVNNMWGSVESGILGVEDNQHLGMWLSDDYHIIESVDDDLKPVTVPELTRKLLITNLYNHTFPIIRYVLDDAVIINEVKDNIFRLASDIQGRADDWFVYGNNLRIHPMAFRHVLGQHAQIDEYQVIQTMHGADIKIVAVGDLDLSVIQQELIESLDSAGLKEPEIHLSLLEKLERHAETGILKRFVPLKLGLTDFRNPR